MIRSAYLDTLVFGGYYDEEFSESTISFFERIIRDKIDLIVSEILTAELQYAPEHVRDLLNLIPNNQI